MSEARTALFQSPRSGFVLSRDDYAACLAARARHDGFGPRGLALFGVCATIVALVLCYIAWPERVAVAAGVGLAAFAVVATVSATWRGALARRWTPPAGGTTVDVAAATDQLLLDVDGVRRLFDWIEVKEVVRAPRHLIIAMREAPAIIVPISAFEDAQGAESFARFVEQRAINAEDNARDAANPNAPD